MRFDLLDCDTGEILLGDDTLTNCQVKLAELVLIGCDAGNFAIGRTNHSDRLDVTVTVDYGIMLAWISNRVWEDKQDKCYAIYAKTVINNYALISFGALNSVKINRDIFNLVTVRHGDMVSYFIDKNFI